MAKPYYAICEGMLDAHPSVWNRISTPKIVNNLYDALCPTVSRLLAMIEEPDATTPREDMTLDFLRQFVNALSPEMQQKFLKLSKEDHSSI